MNRYVLYLLLLSFFTVDLYAGTKGVDHGNPNPQGSFYSMKGGFRILDHLQWKISLHPNTSTLKIDSEARYKKYGYFVIRQLSNIADYTPQPGFVVCREEIPTWGKVRILWLGKDCRHRVLSERFKELVVSVRPIK